MANKYQRKVNKVLKSFNKSFSKDIAPYNQFRLCQFKRIESRDCGYENFYLIHLYKGKELVGTKWFEYLQIVGLGKQVVGSKFFWWLNNSVAWEVHKA